MVYVRKLFFRGLQGSIVTSKDIERFELPIYCKSQIIIDDTLIFDRRVKDVGVIEQLEWYKLPAIYQNII